MKYSIQTKRLILRPYRASDFNIWRAALSQLPFPRNEWDLKPVAPENLTRQRFLTLVKRQQLLRQQDVAVDFAVFDRTTGEHIGFVGLSDIMRGASQNATIGYGIFNPYWGQGYGKEAVSAVIKWGFNSLGVHRIEAAIDPANRRSIRLARSLGMRREGLSTRRLWVRGEWQDMLVFAVTCEEYHIPWRSESQRLRRTS